VGGVLRAVATDGHRLALADMPAPDGANALTGIIVPRKAIAEARRLLDDAPDRVTVSASDSKIVFKVGEAVLTSKLIDGSFPDYQRVIPKENGRILTVDNGDFAGAVDRVATVSAERSRSIKLSLDEGKLTLAVSNAETGQGVEELEAEYADEALEIGFNARYLLDVAQQIEGDETRFEFNDSASPARVIDMKDPAAQYVLMPLRV
ncbi:MAG: DNA polymerase III subunit beta, partial [Pseudomonadota bacterium]